MQFKEFRSKFYTLLGERKNLHINDIRIYDSWDKIIKLLSTNECMTEKIINEMSSTDFYWLSEVFEDLSFSFRSKSFIDTLRKSQKNHMVKGLDIFIDTAEEAMKWDSI